MKKFLSIFLLVSTFLFPQTKNLSIRQYTRTELINKSLESWNIGLKPVTKLKERGDSKIWIVFYDKDCASISDLKETEKTECKNVWEKTPEIYGECLMNINEETGEINSGLIILRAEIIDEISIVPEFKVKVISHEIGHCLGFQHSGYKGFVMHYDTNSWTSLPSEFEQDALKSLYGILPFSSDYYKLYFPTTNSVIVKHKELPDFYTDIRID